METNKKSIYEIIELQEKSKKRMLDLQATATEGSRPFTPTEQREFDLLTQDVNNLKGEYEAIKKEDEKKSRSYNVTVGEDFEAENELKNYSFLNEIKERSEGSLSEITKKNRNKVLAEAKKAGQSVDEKSIVMSWGPTKSRALTMGNTGAYATSTAVVAPTASLQNVSVLEKLGADFQTVLSNTNVTYFKNTTAYFESELAEAQDSLTILAKAEMKPFRIAAVQGVTRRQLESAGPDFENKIIAELMRTYNVKAENQYFSTSTGDTSSFTSLDSSISAYVFNGAVSATGFTAMTSSLDGASGLILEPKFLLNPITAGKAELTLYPSGLTMIANDITRKIKGYEYLTTKNVAISGSSYLAFYGDWSAVSWYNFGVITIDVERVGISDSYNIILNGYTDIKLNREGAISKALLS